MLYYKIFGKWKNEVKEVNRSSNMLIPTFQEIVLLTALVSILETRLWGIKEEQDAVPAVWTEGRNWKTR